MKYIILQLCCFTCNEYQELYTTNERPLQYIKNLFSDNYDSIRDHVFIIFYDGEEIFRFDGSDLKYLI